jgi:elongation factor Ts
MNPEAIIFANSTNFKHMNITAADVNKLRQITGAGMMDCKKALVEANGDFDVAIDELRKKGQKVAANRGDRDASEGLVIAKSVDGGKRGVMIVLNCETDFVAKNENFGVVANNILDVAISGKPADHLSH